MSHLTRLSSPQVCLNFWISREGGEAYLMAQRLTRQIIDREIRGSNPAITPISSLALSSKFRQNEESSCCARSVVPVGCGRHFRSKKAELEARHDNILRGALISRVKVTVLEILMCPSAEFNYFWGKTTRRPAVLLWTVMTFWLSGSTWRKMTFIVIHAATKPLMRMSVSSIMKVFNNQKCSPGAAVCLVKASWSLKSSPDAPVRLWKLPEA